MIGLVLDASALIPCGDKPEHIKEAIRQLSEVIITSKCVVIYLSEHLFSIYRDRVIPILRHEECHPLPRLQSSLSNLLHNITKFHRVKEFDCKHKPLGEVIIHILTSSRIEKYNINGLGLSGEDAKVLQTAITATHYGRVLLITADKHFLNNLNKEELYRRYPELTSKLEIIPPEDPNLLDVLKSCGKARDCDVDQ